MAITKTITKCIPYVNSNNKVDRWDIVMTYQNDNEGDSTYYTSEFRTSVNQKDTDLEGNVIATNFNLKGKGSWSNAELLLIRQNVAHQIIVLTYLVNGRSYST